MGDAEKRRYPRFDPERLKAPQATGGGGTGGRSYPKFDPERLREIPETALQPETPPDVSGYAGYLGGGPPQKTRILTEMGGFQDLEIQDVPEAPPPLTPGEFDRFIQNAAESTGVNPDLMRALMQVESGGDPQVTNEESGAQGLFQIMPANQKALGMTDPYDPEQSTWAAATLLKEMLDRYDGDLELALADWSAGYEAVKQYQGVPPYPETKKLIQAVMRGMGSAPGKPKMQVTREEPGKPARAVPVQQAGVAPPTQAEAGGRTPGQRFRNAFNAYARNLFTDIPVAALESATIVAQQIDRLVGGKSKVESYWAWQVARKIEDFAKKLYPEDLAQRGQFLSDTLPAALGQGTAFIVGGIVAKSRFLFPAGMGAVLGGPQGYKEAEAYGATENEKLISYLLNSGMGISEAMPISNLITRIDRGTGGIFKRALVNSIAETFEEATQEALQQTGANVVAKWLYDNERSLVEGVVAGGGTGGAAGGILGFVTTLLAAALPGRARVGPMPFRVVPEVAPEEEVSPEPSEAPTVPPPGEEFGPPPTGPEFGQPEAQAPPPPSERILVEPPSERGERAGMLPEEFTVAEIENRARLQAATPLAMKWRPRNPEIKRIFDEAYRKALPPVVTITVPEEPTVKEPTKRPTRPTRPVVPPPPPPVEVPPVAEEPEPVIIEEVKSPRLEYQDRYRDWVAGGRKGAKPTIPRALHPNDVLVVQRAVDEEFAVEEPEVAVPITDNLLEGLSTGRKKYSGLLYSDEAILGALRKKKTGTLEGLVQRWLARAANENLDSSVRAVNKLLASLGTKAHTEISAEKEGEVEGEEFITPNRLRALLGSPPGEWPFTMEQVLRSVRHWPAAAVEGMRDEIEEAVRRHRGEEPVPTAEPPKELPAELTERTRRLVKIYEDRLIAGKPPSGPQEVRKLAGPVFGVEEVREGADLALAYDALEVALNNYLTLNMPAHTVSLLTKMQEARKAEDLLPNRTRTLEAAALQQFSTPLDISYAAAYAADVRLDDKVLEPTAGTGNIVAAVEETSKYADSGPTTAIELDAGRVANLKQLIQAGRIRVPVIVLNENALGHRGKYDVVIGNPPWGAKLDPGAHLPFKGTDLSQRFTYRALEKNLNEGGRLVFWMPTNIARAAPFIGWIRQKHTLRAIVQAPPNIYRKRGTTVDTTLLVVDRGKMAVALEPIKGTARNLEELAKLLGPLAQGGNRARVIPEVAPAPGERPEAPPPAVPPGPPPTGRPGRPPGPRGRPPGRPGPGGVEPGGVVEPTVPPPPRVVPRPPGGVLPTPGGEARPGVERPAGAATEGAAFDSFEQYVPTITEYEWAKDIPDHPANIVTTTSLSFVRPPITDYKPHDDALYPKRKNPRAPFNPSKVAVEAMVMMGRALENDHGTLLGDGMGVGKTISYLGFLQDQFSKDRIDTAVIMAPGRIIQRWFEDNKDLFQLPIQDLRQFDPDEPLPPGKIWILSYSQVRKYHQVIRQIYQDTKKGRAVLIMDESQYLKNMEGPNSAQRAEIVNMIQEFLLNERDGNAFYGSATPATHFVDQRIYLGLKEWTNFGDWAGRIVGLAEEEGDAGGSPGDALNTDGSRGGGSARDAFNHPIPKPTLEQIARERVATGKYLARDISFSDVQMKFLDATMTPEEETAFNRLVDFVNDIEKAEIDWGSNRFGVSANARTFILRRFLGQLRAERAFVRAEQALKEKDALGNSKKVGFMVEYGQTNGANFLRSAIEGINQEEAIEDEDGVVDHYEDIPEAIAWYHEKMEEVDQLYQDPVISLMLTPMNDAIAHRFGGHDQVAEVSGRGEQFTWDPKKREWLRKPRKGGAETASLIDSKAFMRGEKRVVVVTEAGTEGINLHDLHGTGQIETFWIDYPFAADKALQKPGRFNRTAQKTAPAIWFPRVNIGGEGNYIGRVVSRLASMGALGRAQAGAGMEAEINEEFDFSSPIMRRAMRDLMTRYQNEEEWDLLVNLISRHRATLADGVSPDRGYIGGRLRSMTMQDFQKWILRLNAKESRKIGEDFSREVTRVVEEAEEQGRTDRIARRTNVELLETLPVGDGNYGISRVKDMAGKEYGVINGVFLRHSRDIRLEGQKAKDAYATAQGKKPGPFRSLWGAWEIQEKTKEGTEETPAEFTPTGERMVGIKIPKYMIQPLARALGGRVALENTDPKTIIRSLKEGTVIHLRGRGAQGRGNPLSLTWAPRLQHIQIQGYTMADFRAEGQRLGVKYVPVGAKFIIPPDNLSQLLEKYPLAADPLAVDPTLQDDSPTGIGGSPYIGPGQRGWRPPRNAGERREVRDRDRIMKRAQQALEKKGIYLGLRLMKKRLKAKGRLTGGDLVEMSRGFANDISTFSHELGHFIHTHVFGRGPTGRPRLKGPPRGHREVLDKVPFWKFREELVPLATKGESKLTEGFAEAVSLWITDNAQAWKKAPHFSQWFQNYFLRVDAAEFEDVVWQIRREWELLRDANEETLFNLRIRRSDPKVHSARKADTFFRTITDQFIHLRRIQEKMTRGEKLETEKDWGKLLDLLNGTFGEANSWVHSRGYQRTYQRTGKKIGRPLMAMVQEVQGELQEYAWYAVAKRAKSRMETHGWDPMEKFGLPAWAVEKVITKYQSEKFDRVLAEMREYAANLVRYYADSAGKSEAWVNRILKADPFYIPIHRLENDDTFVNEQVRKMAAPRGILGRTWNPIKYFKGGDLPIADPIESLVKDTYTVIRRAEENRIVNTMLDAREKAIKEGVHGVDYFIRVLPKGTAAVKVSIEQLNEAIGDDLLKDALAQADEETVEAVGEYITLFLPSTMRPRKPVINAARHGEIVAVELHEQLYEVFDGLNAGTTRVLFNFFLLRYLAAVARTAKAGITLAWRFVTRNIVRDIPSALLRSDHPFKLLFYWPRAAWSVFFMDEMYQKFKATGASLSSFVHRRPQDILRQQVKEISRRERGMPLPALPRGPIQIMEHISETFEMASRAAEAMANGLKKAETFGEMRRIGHLARNVTVDFGRTGMAGLYINPFTIFFNAGIQGSAWTYQTFKRAPFRTVFRGFTLLTIPTLAYYFWQRKNKCWREYPQQQKDTHWVAWMPWQTCEEDPYRLPKPHEMAWVFSTPWERLLEAWNANDPRMVDKLASNFMRQFYPAPMFTAVEALIENAMNYHIYFQQPIVPRGAEEMLPEYRVRPWTGIWAKKLSKALGYVPGVGEIAPAKIEHVVTSWTGTLGWWGGELADEIMKRAHIVDAGVEMKRTPGAGLLTGAWRGRSPRFSSEPAERFWEVYYGTRETNILWSVFTGDFTIRMFSGREPGIREIVATVSALESDRRPDEARKVREKYPRQWRMRNDAQRTARRMHRELQRFAEMQAHPRETTTPESLLREYNLRADRYTKEAGQFLEKWKGRE